MCFSRSWATRQHFGQLRGVVRPRREHLRALIQVVFPDFVEGVGLAVVRFGIFGAVLNGPKSGHAHIIEGSMIGSEGAPHAGFEQVQFAQRRDFLIHDFSILIIVMQGEGEHSSCTGIMHHDS